MSRRSTVLNPSVIRRFMSFLALAIVVSLARILGAEAPASKGGISWPGVKYDKVVAYYFTAKPEAHEFSVMSERGLLEPELAAHKAKEKKMSPAEVDRLLKATFSFAPEYRWPKSACYNPHHVFVFYDKGGKAVAAYEICLECLGCIFWPEPKEKIEAVDYIGISKLLGGLGLGPGGNTNKDTEDLKQLLKAMYDMAKPKESK
jgi:hypothetical protein